MEQQHRNPRHYKHSSIPRNKFSGPQKNQMNEGSSLKNKQIYK